MISTRQLGHAFVLVTVVTLWPDIHSTLYNNSNRLCPHVLTWRVYTIELHRHDSEVVFRPSLVRKLTIDDNELRRLALR